MFLSSLCSIRFKYFLAILSRKVQGRAQCHLPQFSEYITVETLIYRLHAFSCNPLSESSELNPMPSPTILDL